MDVCRAYFVELTTAIPWLAAILLKSTVYENTPHPTHPTPFVVVVVVASHRKEKEKEGSETKLKPPVILSRSLQHSRIIRIFVCMLIVLLVTKKREEINVEYLHIFPL